MKKRVNDLFFIIGLVAVVIMCCSFEVSFSQLWLDIRKAGYWLAAIVGLWFMLYTLNALAWRVILRSNGRCPVRFGRLVKYTVTGFALNSVTPIGLLGGEAYKIMSVSQFMDVKKATSSVILFSMMHIFSHFWFWLTAVGVYFLQSARPTLREICPKISQRSPLRLRFYTCTLESTSYAIGIVIYETLY